MRVGAVLLLLGAACSLPLRRLLTTAWLLMQVTNANKREYVLLKANKMLVGGVETAMTAIIDAFHSLIPRDLLEKYSFTALEMQLLVCGERVVDIEDLKRHCGYQDGYNGKEDVIKW